jgi:hypothetical protein
MVYELPHLVGALALGAGLAAADYLILRELGYLDEPSPALPWLNLAALTALGLLAVAWGARYFPQAVQVYPDRVRFRMLLGAQDILLSMTESIAALSPEEARWALFSVRFAALTPTARGAVIIKRKRGRPWVFSPADTEQFLLKVQPLLHPSGSRSDAAQTL